MIERMNEIVKEIEGMPLHEKVDNLNRIRKMLHKISPFKDNPVDLIQWVPNTSVFANDYNPNSVAPPEMELLRHSIAEDGYTQPIVTWNGSENGLEVVDGFHRNRVGKECKEIQEKVHGYLPVVTIRDEQSDRNNRISSTIRHNRARGKHNIEAMSDIVIELKRRNWSDSKIAKNLGMDEDEVLRLCQITGMADVFADEEFSLSWEIGNEASEEEIEISFEGE